MGILFEIRCSGCDHRDVLELKSREYRMAGRPGIGVETTPAWCRDCGRVVEAELFEATGALQRDVTRLEEASRVSEKFSDLLGMTPAEELAMLKDRLEWRRNRETGPKCVECGSERLDFLEVAERTASGPDGRLSAPHPGCTGRVTAHAVGHRESDEAPIPYSPEGQRLP